MVYTPPIKLMLFTWAVVIFIWIILPFELLRNDFSFIAMFMLFGFIITFCVGVYFNNNYHKPRNLISKGIDIGFSKKIISVVSTTSILCLLIEGIDIFSFDLEDSYKYRSTGGYGLLSGQKSTSSVAFKIAFLTYPAGYIFSVLEIIYSKKISFFKLIIFGFLPILLTSLVLGGRNPIFIIFLLSYLSYQIRTTNLDVLSISKYKSLYSPKRLIIRSILTAASIFVVYYFIVIFFIRAEVVGGGTGMFDIAKSVWGVGFDGPLFDFLLKILGEDLTFLVFIFSWYLVQGLVMSNTIFIDYDGGAMYGNLWVRASYSSYEDN